jgi:hypothetical protein
MKITFYSCDKIMTIPGALVFSPPFKNNNAMSVSTLHKYHICVNCWEKLIKCMENLEDVKITKEKK